MDPYDNLQTIRGAGVEFLAKMLCRGPIEERKLQDR